MKILSLDPSSAYTGWCLYDNDSITAGFLRPLEGEVEGNRYCDLFEQVFTLINTTKPELLLIESYFFSSNFATGCNISVEIRGVLKLLACNLHTPYKMVDPAHWKKIITDRAILLLKGDQFKRCKTLESKTAKWRRMLKSEFGKVKAKKIITVLSLKELSIECPKKIINPYTNKKINFPFDISDALGILLSYLIEEDMAYDPKVNWQFTVVDSSAKPITTKEQA